MSVTDIHNITYGPCWCGIDHMAAAYREAFEAGRASAVIDSNPVGISEAELARALIAVDGLHFKTDPEQPMLYTARAILVVLAHPADPLTGPED